MGSKTFLESLEEKESPLKDKEETTGLELLLFLNNKTIDNRREQ